jgi:hypothetical protein
VPVRVSPTDRIRYQIDELFAQDKPLPEILEQVARLGAQLLMRAALEAEVTEFLGRARGRPADPAVRDRVVTGFTSSRTGLLLAIVARASAPIITRVSRRPATRWGTAGRSWQRGDHVRVAGLQRGRGLRPGRLARRGLVARLPGTGYRLLPPPRGQAGQGF